MKPFLLVLLAQFSFFAINAQKKPLDHSVYDSWQHIGERMISNDGKWVVYTIDPQEGDNELVIQSSDAKYKKTVPRGYNAQITQDSRYLVFKIKPLFKDTRDARIKKKRPDDFPKDSFAIIELGKEGIWKTPRVKAYKTPQKSFGWVAYHLEKAIEPPAKAKPNEPAGNKKLNDSLNHIIDSLEMVIRNMPKEEKKKKKKNKDDDEENDILTSDIIPFTIHAPKAIGARLTNLDADGDDASTAPIETGTDLVVRNTATGAEKTFNYVLEYYFSKTGDKLLLEQSKNPKDSLSKPMVLLYDLKNGNTTVLGKGGNDFKNFVISDDGSQVAYVAERDAKPKDLQKFYKLWYYKQGMDSAIMLVDKNQVGMKLGMTVSEWATNSFSKSGKRLLFGTAPIQPPRDTTIIDIDMPKMDIWHYNDDYLQTTQLYPTRLRNDQQQNYLAVYDLETKTVKQLGTIQIPQVVQTNEGDGDTFIGITDYGKRIESQWQGTTLKDIYAIDVNSGERKLVKENLLGNVYPSSTGKYIMWYDRKAKNYFTWDGSSTKNITQKIKVPLYDETWDTPEEPGNYGVMGWYRGDSSVFVYDRYDAWEINLLNASKIPQIITGSGRKANLRNRYVQLDSEKKFFQLDDLILFNTFDDETKKTGFAFLKFDLLGSGYAKVRIIKEDGTEDAATTENYVHAAVLASKGKDFNLTYTKENFNSPPNLFVSDSPIFVYDKNDLSKPLYAVKLGETRLSSINPQQSNYTWGTAELFKWKAYNGKDATGIVFKPENFDPKKKYPMICYFYETLSDGLNSYREPAPIRSAINVPFFVSRGYIIFMPDIYYTTGHPGKNAYDYIVSGARAIVKKGWADSTKLALQGHSWGGYQAAQLATMTKLFKAVWAGAPVANMTSAYGGIRWESGVNRQFQYEKTQSRIGASLWDKNALSLYLENSPLFHLDKVTAPVVIMANDADGAVPWYQGIELFTGLRRLGKKVWMFNYNGQGHGLTQRQDMKDYQVRMQQFFDWILKGEPPAKWIMEGVPALRKGKDWGLELE
jgi:dipeptidyl aminopeptidase/acylaminoacyl peptidase